MMVRKKLAIVVAIIGALQAAVASALGLGELSINSVLNQPLEAEIRLLNSGELDPTQILVNLGAKEDFDRAGISRDFFLSNLTFKVVISEDGLGVIKIKTQENVIEPYLDFIVEARWPNGRILREYTILLDFPTYSAEPQPTVTAAAASQSAVAPALGKSSITSARESLRQESLEPGAEYRVRRDDSLWEIAAKSRSNSNASVQQTMLAIQRENPNAFIKGNINRLKAGYVLRLPTNNEMVGISENMATKEVAIQNKAWRSRESTPPMLTEAPLDASSATQPTDEEVVDEPRLSIAGTGTVSDASSDGLGSENEGTAALDQALSLAEEKLDQASRYNEELDGRLSDMEATMATLQRLLELKEDQLAALQASMSEDPPIAEPKPIAAVASKPEPKPSLIDQLLANPLYLGGGLITLASVALLLLRRRRSAEEQELRQYIYAEPEAVDEAITDLSVGDEDLVTESAADSEFDEAPEVDLEEANVGDFAAQYEETDTIAQGQSKQAPVQSETGDVIAEADIYIAYGRFPQAIDLLKSAITQEPQRSDLVIKLLEVYLETRDKPSFQEFYLQLQSLDDESAVIEVKEMLSSVEGVAGWLEGLSAPKANLSATEMDHALIDSTGEPNANIDEGLVLEIDSAELDTIDLELNDIEDGSLELDLDLDLDPQDDDLDEAFAAQAEPFDISSSDTQLDSAISLNDPSTELVLELDDELSQDMAELETELALELDSSDEPLSILDTELDFESTLDLDDDLDSEPDLEGTYELDTKPNLESTLNLGDEPDLDDMLELDEDLDDDLDAELESMKFAGDLGDLESELQGLDLDMSGVESDVDVSSGESPELVEALDFNLSDESALDISATEFESSDSFDLMAKEDDLSALEDTLNEQYLTDQPAHEEVAGQASAIEPPILNASIEEREATEDNLDFLSDSNEVATKLDLARAYIDMGDTDGAKDILDEVIQEGSDEQIQEANSLLERV